MGRAPAYGASKIGLNGLTVHMQVAENDRVSGDNGISSLRTHINGTGTGTIVDVGVDRDERVKPRIRFYVCAPGVLKTAFSRYYPAGKEPEDGAEVAVRLIEDDGGLYEGGSYWEVEEGEMKRVPW